MNYAAQRASPPYPTPEDPNETSLSQHRLINPLRPTVVLSPADIQKIDSQVFDSFFHNLFDLRRAFYGVLAIAIIAVIGCITLGTGWLLYSRQHAYVKTIWVDTNMVRTAPYRIYTFDESGTPDDKFIFYHLRRITTQLFSYTLDTIKLNRAEILPFLAPEAIRKLTQNTEQLLKEHSLKAEFPGGDAYAEVLADPVVLSRDQQANTMQVSIPVAQSHTSGMNHNPKQYFYIIYTIRLHVPFTDATMATLNPVSIHIVDWQVLATTEPPLTRPIPTQTPDTPESKQPGSTPPQNGIPTSPSTETEQTND